MNEVEWRVGVILDEGERNLAAGMATSSIKIERFAASLVQPFAPDRLTERGGGLGHADEKARAW